MRGKEITKRDYRDGDERTVERFLWFPMRLKTKRQPENKSFWRYQWRWLEKAWILKKLEASWGDYYWWNVRWDE